GSAPLSVAFTNQSSDGQGFVWAFGDSQTSTLVNPVHNYLAAGLYSVSLTVTNSAGTDTLTRTDYVLVTNIPPPLANFSGNPTSGAAPLTVSFTNTSSGVISNFAWNF